MKPGVEQAIHELREGLPDNDVRIQNDGDGGAFVIVDGVEIGSNFAPALSWVGFQITFPYPDVDVYPHFLDPTIRYVGAGPAPNEHPEGNLPVAMTRGAMMPGFDCPSVQVSRRSNRRDAMTDTALQKLLRVLGFLRSR
jgi:hypothetical protein